MSFICENCKKVQPKNSRPIKIVTQKRDKVYPRKMEGDTVLDAGGYGWEIVKELTLCETCGIESTQ